MSYLRTLTTLTPTIEASGGKVVIATAEPLNFLAETRKTSGYQGEAIVDPENELAEHLKAKGFLDVAISEKKGYPHVRLLYSLSLIPRFSQSFQA